MLKTCFSARKGYHLQEEYEEYDISYVITSNTVGFEQLHWNNQFNYLLPTDDKEDGEDDEAETSISKDKEDEVEINQSHTLSKKQKLSKTERKELRKMKRQQRKQPRNLRSTTSALNQDFEDSILLMHQVPESFELHNTSLYKQDLHTLKDQEWLNDNIITYVYNILETYQLKPFYQKYSLNENTILLLPPSLCYLVLVSTDPQSLISMFPEQFQKCKFLILPLNDGGSHWSLSVISILDKTFYSFDSLTNLNIEENDLICSNFSIIISQLNKQAKYKLVRKTLNTPQQLNDSDCGIFVICLTCFVISELIGANLTKNSSSWKLDFNLNFKIKNVDTPAIRRIILKSIIDGVIKN